MKIALHLRSLILSAAVSGVMLAAGAICRGDDAPKTGDTSNGPKLYVVGYTHLDTQWRWSYPQVISEFLRNTLRDNFALFDKYPHYVFNFTGSNRYMMFKEYYPADYEKMKKFIAEGRWFPGGSSVEEGDVNMPDGESLIRQVLYGNEYFRREFGKQSCEYMLPDCFGFQASLPSILNHCGLKGFSTQKLTWGSAVGVPFNVGVWDGPDGKSIIAALNCTPYDSKLNDDLSHDKNWIHRVDEDGQKYGVPIDYRYYGAGDRGGSVGARSLDWLEKSVTGNGPLKVISGTSEQMFVDLTPAQIAKLPHYKGDLLLTGHSTGELTSEAFMKRCERKLENLADAAERASVAANWLGGAVYPMEKINAAWTLALGSQFHDTMAGTALPKSYEYTWNNEILALNQFAAVAEDGCGAVIRAMDTTSAGGVPMVVYNPLTIDREDVTDATITVPDTFKDAVIVVGPDGKPVPSQIVSRDGNKLHLLFLAKVPSVGFATFEVRPGEPEKSGSLSVTENTLENSRFKVTLNEDGDIASIFDKIDHRETLSSPARLEFLHENPEAWPAWNMDYVDRMHAPIGYVTGPCKTRIVENGPARVAIEVDRMAMGSTFRQTISLSAGSAGDRVEVANVIDWRTKEVSLEAVFPLTAGNPVATYESQSAAVERGNNTTKKFEVPQQQWFDLTDSSKNFGTSILNDCKYGSDKPDDKTVRLTLLYTPGTRAGYQDQGSQDLGRNEVVYAIAPHSDTWQKAGTPAIAQRLNQPLLAFAAPAHAGSLGRSISLCKISSDRVTATAIKKAEDSDEIIIRLHETAGGEPVKVQVGFAGNIVSAREVDGQEREIGKAEVLENGKLSTTMTAFSLRAFAVKIAPPASMLKGPTSVNVALDYDLDAVSNHENLADGAFDPEGHTYPGEALPETIEREGITFKMGPTADGKKNALICKGQSIALPADCNRVYFLASALNGDIPATFQIDGKPHDLVIEDWASPIGLWDNRIWQGMVPMLTYDFKNRLAGLTPGFIKRANVAWYSSHRHDPTRGNEYYKYTYLFKYGIDLPGGAKQITLPDNDKVRIFAMTASNNGNDDAHAARPLYDLLNHSDLSGPTLSPVAGTFNDSTLVTIEPPLYYAEHGLHYTTDGSEPTADSPVYTQPLRISQKTTVKAKEIDESGSGATSTAIYDVNDTTAPTVLSVAGAAILPTIQVHFSEPVRKDQAETAGSYQFTPALSITTAALSQDGMTATLTLGELPKASDQYHLKITGVADVSPNANAVSPAPMPVTLAKPVYTLDSFEAAGSGLEKKDVKDLPVKAGDSWTINFFVKPKGQPDDRTIIAGFGRNEDGSSGLGRYLTKFSGGLHFWSCNADVDTSVPLEIRRWQMLTATYDGKTLRVYKNGQPAGEEAIALSNDEATVRIAPLDPWERKRQFQGELRGFTIWRTALPAESLKMLMEAMPK